MNQNRSMERQPRPNRAHSRRSILRYAAVGGAGLTAALTFACRSDKTTPSGSSPAAGATSAGTGATRSGQGIAALLGRSATPATGEQPVSGGVHKALFTTNPPTLDPHGTIQVFTIQGGSAAYSRLIRPKGSWDVAESINLKTEPELALTLESPDVVTWTVKLRQDARFHTIAPVNGHAVEAEDVKATFTRALSPVNVNRGSLTMIDPAQIQTPDAHTVIFKLKYPYAPFRDLLSSALYSLIMPREIAGGLDPTKQAIGSGPFIFENFTPDVSMSFRRNPDWFEKGKPHVNQVLGAVVTDPSQRLAQFTGGNVFTTGVETEDLETMKRQNPRADVIANLDAGNGQVFFQLGDPSSPFRDIRLRQAVSLAIDRETYGRVIRHDKYALGFGVPPRLGKTALSVEDLPEDVRQWYTFDLQKAKQLIAAAGGEKLTIKMLKPEPYPPDPSFETAGEMVANMLNQLPWKVQFVLVDYNKDWLGGGKGVRYGNYPGDSILWSGLGGRTNADEYLFEFYDSRSTGNVSKLADPRIDELIDKARATVNEEEQARAYIEVQKYLASQVYFVGAIPMGLTYTLVQPQVRNYLLGDAYGIAPVTWAQLWLKQ